MATNTLCLTADVSQATACIEELAVLVDAAKLAPEICDALVHLSKCRDQLFTFDRDDAVAPGTGELRFVLKPTDGLLRLVAAARAGNLNLSVIEQAFGHRTLPSSEAPMLPPGASS